jgi:hypothetical protein
MTQKGTFKPLLLLSKLFNWLGKMSCCSYIKTSLPWSSKESLISLLRRAMFITYKSPLISLHPYKVKLRTPGAQAVSRTDPRWDPQSEAKNWIDTISFTSPLKL